MSCEDPGIPQRYGPSVPEYRLSVECFRTHLEQFLHHFSSKLKVPGIGDVGGKFHVVADAEGDRDEPPLVLHLDGHSVIEEPGGDSEVIRNLDIAQDCPRSQANLTLNIYLIERDSMQPDGCVSFVAHILFIAQLKSLILPWT